MIDVETEIHPPEPDEDENGDDGPSLRISATLLDVGDTHYDASAQLFGDDCADPERIADLLVRVTLALSNLYGSEVAWAVRQRLWTGGQS